MKIGNDNTGIVNKVVTNLLSKEDWVIEEEEFKKKTKLDISKESLKQNVKDGDTNTYTLNILNVGDNPARIVKIEEELQGNAKIKKDSVRVLNSKGQDVTNDKNIVLKKDITDKKITAIIDNILKDEKYKVVYDVIYDSSETENNVKTTSKVRGLNTEEKQIEDTTNVNGTIKDTSLEIFKKSDKKEVKAGDINTYTTSITNTGDYAARNVHIEEKIEGNANIVKTSVKVINSKGEDITKTLKKEDLIVKDNNIIVNIPNISSKEKYKIIYDVKYDNSEKDNIVKTITKVKGSNTKEEEKISNYNVKGTVKETTIEVKKTVDKNIIEAGDKNKYKITVKNIGSYDARDITIEDILKGNAKYIKDTIKASDKNIKVEIQKNIKFNIPLLEKGKEIEITYDVEYGSSEKDNIVTNDVEVKGSNVKKNTSTAKVEVLGVKENIVEKEILPKILPKAGKRQRRQIAIYTIIALVLIVPILIIRREYIQAKKRQMSRKNRRR